MRYNHINKFLTTALLLTFIAPAGMSYPSYGGYNSYDKGDSYAVSSTTNLSSSSKLSDKNEKITLSLRDSDVKQVLRMFADKAGKNIVFHSSVKGSVTLDLVDMPINDAFTLVLQVSNLNYYIKDNTLIVLATNSTDNTAFSKQEMMIFPVKYVSAAKIASFLNKNVFGIKKSGMSGGDAATVNSATNEVIVFGQPSDAAIVRNVIAQLDKEPLSRTFIVNHTTPSEMADMICNLLLPAHGVGSSSGGGHSDYTIPTPGVGTGLAASITGGASSTSSSSSSESIKLGEGVVACTINQSASGSTTSSFDVQNIAISYYPQRGSILMIGGSEAQIDLVERFIKDNDIKQPQAYLEVSIIELNEDGSKMFQNEWSLQSEAWNVSFNNGITSGGRKALPSGLAEYLTLKKPVDEEVKTGTSSYTQSKMVDDFKDRALLYKNGTYISWTMNYLIENKKARVLANPKIIITNGQESVIDLTEDYVEKVTSEFLSSTANTLTTGAVQKTYTIGSDKGIKVSLIPFISPDGYVTLNIKPDYATEASKVYEGNAAGGQDLVATLLNRRNLDLKNVRIKDGETLVIGGMINEAEMKTVQKIPVLGDLPLVGAAFRSTTTSKAKAELVIMITPRIIRDGEEAVADRL